MNLLIVVKSLEGDQKATLQMLIIPPTLTQHLNVHQLIVTHPVMVVAPRNLRLNERKIPRKHYALL